VSTREEQEKKDKNKNSKTKTLTTDVERSDLFTVIRHFSSRFIFS
jgi:hypothetical protein